MADEKYAERLEQVAARIESARGRIKKMTQPPESKGPEQADQSKTARPPRLKVFNGQR